ncbi:MAG: Cys-tRNA(Pro)/Cys-tRNA(Cys) deacylase [Pseudoclavibacter caeni]|jgi:Cys-tRNA(Pro)/Cys-tRNA(Cys) deacylase
MPHASRGRGSATPAIRALDRIGVPYRLLGFDHDPAVTDFGDEAVACLPLPAPQVLKTLVVETDARDVPLAVGVVSVAGRLDLKALAHALGCKRCRMAAPAVAERRTGYVVGGISPLGQRTRLPIVIDDGVLAQPLVVVSGGRRGLDVELAPADLVRATGARTAPIERD